MVLGPLRSLCPEKKNTIPQVESQSSFFGPKSLVKSHVPVEQFQFLPNFQGDISFRAHLRIIYTVKTIRMSFQPSFVKKPVALVNLVPSCLLPLASPLASIDQCAAADEVWLKVASAKINESWSHMSHGGGVPMGKSPIAGWFIVEKPIIRRNDNWR